MSSASSSRDIVEDFLRYKLLSTGLTWRDPPRRRRTGGQRRHNAAASAASAASALTASSGRPERAVTSHRGVAVEDSQQGPSSSPTRLQVALRCAGDELEQRYRGDLAAQVSVLLLCDGGVAELLRGLTAVREELFRDGVNWGRIVAMMALGGALSAEVAHTDGAWRVDDIAAWLEESLDSQPLRGWIEDNGGWDAFTELYGDSRPRARFWSLATVFGLAVLGAAGITLGALFIRR
ncbi:apoptosis regulator Bcl-2 [Dicentrarchus labrax]|uniref:Apoptosis regulator Bcl-2 family BH4 domain-containing protein n=1 Tax=Dicentrarchus labrax TaxID=13489 RepID=A0A8P4GM38_DICLA|nr:apoptosis regulator Bcl-2 [Dicentrarchus labrax]